MVEVAQLRKEWAPEGGTSSQAASLPDALPALGPNISEALAAAHMSFPCRDQRLKRLFDVVVSTVSLVVLLPVMAFIWIAVVSTSSGPALFMSSRVGRYGRTFLMPKFRTMVMGVRNCTRESLNCADDPVTLVGKLLRRLGLDELPQLWCVLRGDMSLIGPRPLLADDPGTLERMRFPVSLAMRPGISGLAQVSGRNLVSPRRKARLDAFYARSSSLGFDMVLLARTLVVVASGKGFM
jgi:O-antigen biosynthesis protein WbqP